MKHDDLVWKVARTASSADLALVADGGDTEERNPDGTTLLYIDGRKIHMRAQQAPPWARFYSRYSVNQHVRDARQRRVRNRSLVDRTCRGSASTDAARAAGTLQAPPEAGENRCARATRHSCKQRITPIIRAAAGYGIVESAIDTMAAFMLLWKRRLWAHAWQV